MAELMQHQKEISDFIHENKRVLVFADAGTGKTFAVLDAARRHRTNGGGRVLVICTKAIMRPAWVDDCAKFTPELSIAVAEAPAKTRREAFESGADIVVVNHDGAKWLADNMHLLDGFEFLAVDESTAFKNKDSQRSKAIAKVAQHFDVRLAMTGTPMPNGLLDVWHQAYLVDDGAHLGARYYAFRAATHDPVEVAMGIKNWIPKAGAEEVVADLISPITLRYRLEDCVDLPNNHTTYRMIDLTGRLRRYYAEMEQDALIELEGEDVTAVNAAALAGKLSQIASGSVYGLDKDAYTLAPDRYDLIADLVAERAHTLVAFQWRHQRQGILAALERAGITDVAVIDGENNKDVHDTVHRFQNGEYRALLAHPASAGHGLTLTRANTVIWASPTWNAEHFEQFNRRIYRTGQTQKTETIIIAARGTVDERAMDRLLGKVDRQTSTMELLRSMHPARAA